MGYYNSFVVKIWSEEPGGRVRGHIQHVSSQESCNFLDLDKIVEFITAHLGPPSPAGEREELGDAIHENRNER
ncbi:MAG: hypothetical protein SVP26_10160 [Chloroflexota bacterium]|nr:hypothetical protein [Chloroflexota bacterium]